MDPTDFHKTAELLKDKKDECHVRTSINRSYYGLFLYLREFFAHAGVIMPDRKVKSHHQFVQECLHEARFFGTQAGSGKGRSRDKVIFEIWTRLRSLLQRRTDADYNLHTTVRPNDGQDSLRLATSTIQDFDSLRGSPREQHILTVAKSNAERITSANR
jgi:hypothetical protein